MNEKQMAAEILDMKNALVYCKHQAESMRTWNGGNWTYHPIAAKRIYDAATNAIARLAYHNEGNYT